MAIALALLVSADPVTIQQFSHVLQELSIAPDIAPGVCQEALASIRLSNHRKFDTVIVDLQLGETVWTDFERGASLPIKTGRR